jgi:hypothetical protein
VPALRREKSTEYDLRGCVVRLLHRLYYAFNRWRYGDSYGCGRCHHAVCFHYERSERCHVKGCPCPGYSIERTTSTSDARTARQDGGADEATGAT